LNGIHLDFIKDCLDYNLSTKRDPTHYKRQSEGLQVVRHNPAATKLCEKKNTIGKPEVVYSSIVVCVFLRESEEIAEYSLQINAKNY